MFNPSRMLPREGVVVTYPHGVSPRGVLVIVCSVITVALAALVVALRFITRSRILNFVGKEDWCILVSLIFSVGNSIGMIFQATTGLGQHMNELSSHQLEDFLKGSWFTILLYNISLTFVKLSILLLYLRLFNVTKIRNACYGMLGVVIVYGLWLFFCALFTCVPIARNWDSSIPGGCIPSTPMWFTNASLNIATDLGIFILPMPVIRTLILPRRQKIGLYIVFALGFFVCLISMLRLHWLTIATVTSDPTWDNTGIANWSVVELNMAIICPSLTTLKPLISRLFPRLLSGGESHTTYHHYGEGVDADSFKEPRVMQQENSSMTLSDGGSARVARNDVDILYSEQNYPLAPRK